MKVEQRTPHELVARHVENAKSLYDVSLLALRLTPIPFILFFAFTCVAAVAGWRVQDQQGMVALLDVGIISGLLFTGAMITAGLGKRSFRLARCVRDANRQISDDVDDAPTHAPDPGSSTTG